jgi:anti-sigma factor RsiW
MTDRPTADPRDSADLPCNVFVGLVTDYLEDALSDADRARVDAHLATCVGCETVLEQWRLTIALTGRLGDDAVDAIDPQTRLNLLATFRELRH